MKAFVETTLELYLMDQSTRPTKLQTMDENQPLFRKYSVTLQLKKLENPDVIVTGRDYFQVISYSKRIGDHKEYL